MTGRISKFSEDPRSGVAIIHLNDGNYCFIESGYGMRSISSCFGSISDAIGQEIYYEVDKLNIMMGFTPVNEMEEV